MVYVPLVELIVILLPAVILFTGRSPLTELLKSLIFETEWLWLDRLFQAVTPSPTLKIRLVKSYPGSPLANTGLAEFHWEAVPFLKVIRLFTAILKYSPIIE
jgi:hypothetical protein